MSLRFKIRPAKKEDLETVMALERITADAPHWAESDYKTAIENGPDSILQRCFLIAEREDEDQRGDLIGFAVAKAIGTGAEGTAELESIVVAANARRSGVGQALCTTVLQWCRHLEIPNVELEVRLSNYRAKGLYSRIGFIPIGLRKRYFQNPEEDAVQMQIALLP